MSKLTVPSFRARKRRLDGEPLVVRCDDLGGGRHDRAAGAIIAGERDDRGRIVLLKPREAGGIGPAKTVDRLVAVADHADGPLAAVVRSPAGFRRDT